MKQASSIDEYLDGVPKEARAALEKLRKVIRAAAPAATEAISYGMPTFKYKGNLVAFAAFKKHLSFFVMSGSVLEAHQEELKDYYAAKGTLHFTPDKPLPTALVKRLVKARIEENDARARKGKAQGTTERESRLKRPRYPMPDDFRNGLEERGLMDAYRQRPAYQQNDYIGWITRAKQEATRRKRLDQMLEELESGDVYMKMAYKPKKGKRVVP